MSCFSQHCKKAKDLFFKHGYNDETVREYEKAVDTLMSELKTLNVKTKEQLEDFVFLYYLSYTVLKFTWHSKSSICNTTVLNVLAYHTEPEILKQLDNEALELIASQIKVDGKTTQHEKMLKASLTTYISVLLRKYFDQNEQKFLAFASNAKEENVKSLKQYEEKVKQFVKKTSHKDQLMDMFSTFLPPEVIEKKKAVLEKRIEKIAKRLEGECEKCGKKDSKNRCSRCKKAVYCSRDCQIADWSKHKLECKPAKS